MTMRINLIRHGMTAGNLKKRYIGTTDEALCPEGVTGLAGVHYGTADVWFLSPMRRCLETAELLEENCRLAKEALGNGRDAKQNAGQNAWRNKRIVPDFRECDFGLFENKNYRELSGSPEYQRWIDSGGALPFPGGESVEAFKERCCRAFCEAVEEMLHQGWKTAHLVVHGGTIMSIMERYALPRQDYYAWHVENGCGYQVCLEETRWREQSCFLEYAPLDGGGFSEKRTI